MSTNEQQIAALAEVGIDLPLLESTQAEVAEEPAMMEVVEEIILLAPGELRAAVAEDSLPDDDEAFAIDPGQFVVTGFGVGRAEPVSVDDGGTLVPTQATMTRAFSYQVPEDSAELEFWAPGAESPVMLELGDAPAHHEH